MFESVPESCVKSNNSENIDEKTNYTGDEDGPRKISDRVLVKCSVSIRILLELNSLPSSPQ